MPAHGRRRRLAEIAGKLAAVIVARIILEIAIAITAAAAAARNDHDVGIPVAVGKRVH